MFSAGTMPKEWRYRSGNGGLSVTKGLATVSPNWQISRLNDKVVTFRRGNNVASSGVGSARFWNVDVSLSFILSSLQTQATRSIFDEKVIQSSSSASESLFTSLTLHTTYPGDTSARTSLAALAR